MTAAALLLALAAAPCPLPEGGADRAAACQLLARPPLAPAVPVAGLEALYRRPGFERARRAGGATWGGWLAGLQARLGELFESRGAEAYSSATRVLVLALALAGAVAAGLGARRRRRRRPGPREAPPEAATPPVDLTAEVARARALAPAAPREAIRLGLAALVAVLEARELAPRGRGHTNRELALALPARGAPTGVAASVPPLVAWFDQAFYSLDPVTPAEALDFLGRLEALAGPGGLA